jgi:hypothetical protein
MEQGSEEDSNDDIEIDLSDLDTQTLIKLQVRYSRFLSFIIYKNINKGIC